MPQSSNWPFKRILVDHLFHGTTRVWWELEPSFNVPGPYKFQLQAGYTGQNSALDWIDIGNQATNAYYLVDDTVREHSGKQQLTHYRVLMTVGGKNYVSNPQGPWGHMDKKDWLLAREIVRKERLRLDETSAAGYLIRKFHYGVINTKNTDFLTNEITDSSHPESWGTAFKLGYHPPVNLPISFETETISHVRGGDNIADYNSRKDVLLGRVVAFPDIFKEDIWVDAGTDQRYLIDRISIIAAWRKVPLVYQVELKLVEFNNTIYRIPVDPDFSYQQNEHAASPGIGGINNAENQPITGQGCVRVDHDYGGAGTYLYQIEGDCCPIAGATILIFNKTDWVGGARTASFAVATSQTDINGAWTWAVMLDPGEYVVQFEKPGQYGPDSAWLTVQPPDPGPPPDPYCNTADSSSSRSNSSFSDSFGSF